MGEQCKKIIVSQTMETVGGKGTTFSFPGPLPARLTPMLIHAKSIGFSKFLC